MVQTLSGSIQRSLWERHSTSNPRSRHKLLCMWWPRERIRETIQIDEQWHYLEAMVVNRVRQLYERSSINRFCSLAIGRSSLMLFILLLAILSSCRFVQEQIAVGMSSNLLLDRSMQDIEGTDDGNSFPCGMLWVSRLLWWSVKVRSWGREKSSMGISDILLWETSNSRRPRKRSICGEMTEILFWLSWSLRS